MKKRVRRRWERGKRKTNEGREVGQVGLKQGEMELWREVALEGNWGE